MATQKAAQWFPSLTKSHTTSSSYTIVSTSSIVVVLVLNINDVTGLLAALLQRPHAHFVIVDGILPS